MAITFLQLAQKVLEEAKQPLFVPEIWATALSKGYEKLIDSKGKTPSATLGALMYVDVRDNTANVFMPVGVRPKRFILKSQIDAIGGKIPDTTVAPAIALNKPDFLEKDLHPLMVLDEYQLISKGIR